jgi:hypothetical protein
MQRCVTSHFFVYKGTGLGSKANWGCSGASRPMHHLAGLAKKQDGSELVTTLHYITMMQRLRFTLVF